MFYKKSMVAAAALLTAAAAQAQSAGSTIVSTGWFHIAPQVKSDPLRVTSMGGRPVNLERTGTGADVDAADTLGLSVTHFFTDNISGELVGGIPPKHDIVGTGTLERFGKLGEVRQWSPAVLVKYHFGAATDKFRPYVGLGVNYTWFRDAKITNDQFATATFGPGSRTTAKADSSWNPVLNVGATYAITDRWYAGLSVSYLPLKTTAKLDTTTATGVKVTSETKIKLRPIVTFLNIGYRF
jgi:outer membrane protein